MWIFSTRIPEILRKILRAEADFEMTSTQMALILARFLDPKFDNRLRKN